MVVGWVESAYVRTRWSLNATEYITAWMEWWNEIHTRVARCVYHTAQFSACAFDVYMRTAAIPRRLMLGFKLTTHHQVNRI